jgi:hypothetical protein
MHQYTHIISIQDILNLYWNVQLIHTQREGNRYAYFLVKIGSSRGDKFVFWNDHPSNMCTLLAANALRIVVLRL